MANISGTFVADGVSDTITGLQGVCDAVVKFGGGSKGNIYLQASYDGGTTFYNVSDGKISNGGSVDAVFMAGDSTVIYRFKATGVSGSVFYFLGQG